VANAFPGPAPIVGRAHILPTDSVSSRVLAKQGDIAHEKARFLVAFADAERRYATILSSTHNPKLAATLRFHAAILGDPELRGAIETAITDHSRSAADAIDAAFETAAASVGAHGGYLGARADDVREVRDRVMDKLLGKLAKTRKIRFREPTVVVCERLTVDCLTRFDAKNVVAVLCAAGGINSHAAIALAAEDIPLSIDPYLHAVVRDGEIIAVDIARPDRPAPSGATGKIVLPDGTGITVAPLVNSLADTQRPGFSDFAGIGLVRTEFAILAAGTFPSIEEQYRNYLRIADAMKGKHVCFRLYDIEPDKPVYTGSRSYGARFLVGHPGILEDQLTALLMTGVGRSVDILVPMVESADDLTEIVRRFSICRSRVAELDPNREADVRLGAMIETRRAADRFAMFSGIAFVSIGSNDLAADLFGQTRTETGFDPHRFTDPAFLGLLAGIVDIAREKGIEVSLCGAAADFPDAVLAAARLGITRFAPSVQAAYAVYPRLSQHRAGGN